jgi:hypothetical protein
LNELPALPKGTAGKIWRGILSLLWKGFVVESGTTAKIAGGEIPLAVVFVRLVVTSLADTAFGVGDAVLDFVATNG